MYDYISAFLSGAAFTGVLALVVSQLMSSIQAIQGARLSAAALKTTDTLRMEGATFYNDSSHVQAIFPDGNSMSICHVTGPEPKASLIAADIASLLNG